MENIFAVALVAAFVVVLVVVFLQHRNQTTLIAALTEAVKQTSSNTAWLDTVEKLAVQVVPASLVEQTNRGADFLKTITDDQTDTLIEAFRDLLNKVTDGKPNSPPPAG